MRSKWGALLLVLAVGIGLILLNAAPDENGGAAASARRSPRTTSLSTLAPGGLAPAATPTTVGLRPPQQVTVLVANGTKVKGAAGKVKQQLAAAGYSALAPTDTTVTDVQTTTVQFADGFQAEAAVIAQSLNLPTPAVVPLANPLPLPSINNASVLVVLGTDFAAQLAGQAPPNDPGNPAAPPPTSRPTTTVSRPTTTNHTTTTRR